MQKFDDVKLSLIFSIGENIGERCILIYNSFYVLAL